MTTQTHPLILAGTYHFPPANQTGVTVARDGCSVVIYPRDLPGLQAEVEDHGRTAFHGVPLDESDLASIRDYARRMGVLA